MANESAVALTETEVLTAPPCTGDVYAVNGILQITPDIEEEINNMSDILNHQIGLMG